MILYIHGFAGSGRGRKADLVRGFFGDEAMAPSLSYVPDLAMDTLVQLVERTLQREPLFLVGSSLGGFYALCLAERYRLRSVLINPSLEPWKTLGEPGMATNFYDLTRFEWSLGHIATLEALAPDTVADPRRYMLMLQTGDDVIDYRIALEKLRGAKTIVEEGGSHAFENFENHLPGIAEFFGLPIRPEIT
ncbi:YqiA/YcfP family alpha/beta fold hydrolase [Hydrogenimonas sp.]